MERMTSEQFESEFWRILTKNRLADLSQFHKPGFHDECPLYTRFSDLAFASSLNRAKTNSLLLATSLKYLRSVIAYEKHSRPYCAAITVWDHGDEFIVPNLFVWFDEMDMLEESLALSDAHSSFAKKLKARVAKLRLPDECDVLEDDATVADLCRVFIGPARHPYENVVPVSRFLQTALAA